MKIYIVDLHIQNSSQEDDLLENVSTEIEQPASIDCRAVAPGHVCMCVGKGIACVLWNWNAHQSRPI